MGMDISGKNATSEIGEYFRNNVWWWRPLADYANKVAPEITGNCIYWQSNDGDGLNATDSITLADALQQQIDSGECHLYSELRKAELDGTPDNPCKYCRATGIRDDAVGVSNGFNTRVIEVSEGHPRAGQKGWCNGCDGKGTVRPDSTQYPFSVENVQAFVHFLRACGGFEIW